MYSVRGYPDAYMTFYQKHSKECRDELSIANSVCNYRPTSAKILQVVNVHFYWFRIQSCHVHGFKLFHKFLVIMIEGLSVEEKSTKTKITTNAHFMF